MQSVNTRINTTRINITTRINLFKVYRSFVQIKIIYTSLYENINKTVRVTEKDGQTNKNRVIREKKRAYELP